MPTRFDARTFVRVDTGYDEHPKVMPLSDSAFRAHIEAICWSGRNHRQNGLIPAAVARKKWRGKVLAELVDAGLLDPDDDGYLVHDYLDFNRSAEEISAYRDARGDAGALGNHKRWHVARRRSDPDCTYCQKEGRIRVAK